MSSENLERRADGPQLDDLGDRLSALPAHDLDRCRTSHLRRQAKVLLADEHRRASRSWLAPMGEVYRRVLEPAWVAALGLAYLSWALLTAASLHG